MTETIARSPESTSPAPEIVQRVDRLISNIESVIFGKREIVTLAVVGLLSEGHILLEDVPGTGKTTLARALAGSIDGEFRRIQFTSDLLPADVIGVSVYSAREEEFRFQPGPIFANVVLADELNRTTPRTQSSLLEAMSEGAVSADGKPLALPRPFMVIATQNPIAFEGTYPLPESQLDRFLVKLAMGYPERDYEREVLRNHRNPENRRTIQPVLTQAEVVQLIDATSNVSMSGSLLDYALDILQATRSSDRLLLGVSSRGGVALLRAAQAHALIEGRSYCVPDDIKLLAPHVFGHRIVPAPGSDQSLTGDELMRELLETVRAPRS